MDVVFETVSGALFRRAHVVTPIVLVCHIMGAECMVEEGEEVHQLADASILSSSVVVSADYSFAEYTMRKPFLLAMLTGAEGES